MLINLILTSSILSTITLNELTGQAKIVASDTFRPFEVYAALLIVYAALTWLVSIGIGLLHRRLNRDMQEQVRLMRYADFTPYDLVLLLQGLGVIDRPVPRHLADRHPRRHAVGDRALLPRAGADAGHHLPGGAAQELAGAGAALPGVLRLPGLLPG